MGEAMPPALMPLAVALLLSSVSAQYANYYDNLNSDLPAYYYQQPWIRTDESPSSGMTVLEVNLPSGYYLQQQTLDAYVRSGVVRNLREARYQEKKLEMYFDYLDSSPVCVNFTAQRWYPVANMMRFISIRVYDYYAPERFNETMYELYNPCALSICHVCTSRQRSYYPVFSGEHRSTVPHLPELVLSIAVTVALQYVWSRHSG